MKDLVNRMVSKRAGLFCATVAAGLYGFAGMFRRVAGAFQDPFEDLSHGWPVAAFAAYVLWTQRKEMRDEAGAGSWWGVAACVLCAGMAVFGTRGLQLRFEQLGFIGLVAALPWAFFGAKTAKRCVFPAVFLLFTIPLASFLDAVTIHLRLFASGTAFAFLKGFGMEVVQQGTAIVKEGAHPFNIDVAEPCSGLRSLFALMALTLAYAWHTQPTWLRRGLLFACAVPLAVLGNVVRILSICLVAGCMSRDIAMGFYHDYSGYVVFFVAIVCMVAVGELIARCAKGMRDEGQGMREKGESLPQISQMTQIEGEGTRDKGNGKWDWVKGLVVFVVLGGMFVFQGREVKFEVAEALEVEWPAELAGYQTDDIFYCQSEKCARSFMASRLEAGQKVCPICGGDLDGAAISENTVLPSDTKIVKKVYRTPYGHQFVVSAVIGGATKSSIHRPELCMPAQGFQMSNPVDFTAGEWPFHAIQLRRAMTPPSLHVYTFFNQAGLRTASHVRRIFADVADRALRGRIDRWVMVTVGVSGPGGFTFDDAGDRAVLTEFLARLSAAALPGEKGDTGR